MSVEPEPAAGSRVGQPSPDARRPQAYQQVKTAIMNGGLAPGSRSTEAGVAARARISRPPFARRSGASTKGFVEPTGRSGFAVAELNPETIRETYEVRLSPESSAMRYAFDRIPSNEVLTPWRQRDLAERLERQEVRAFTEFSESDLAFHDLWVKHFGNSMLTRHIDRLRGHVVRVHRQAPLPVAHTIASSQEYLLILDAIAGGSAQRARDAVEEHIAAVAQRIAAGFDD
jgi:DNA-binding GntR family transcriptional regulator